MENREEDCEAPLLDGVSQNGEMLEFENASELPVQTNENDNSRKHRTLDDFPSPCTLDSHKDRERMKYHVLEELRMFRICAFWLGLNQSSALNVTASWIVFAFFAIIVPIIVLSLVDCSHCDFAHSHPFEKLVQISEAALAVISFLCLSHNLRKYGLRRFLFLDQICEESSKVQCDYREELNKASRILTVILVPSFLVELVYQVWWFTYATVHLPFIQSKVAKNVLMCSAVIVSWLYKTSVFLFSCILFRLMCYLQNLRFEGFIKLLEDQSEVPLILKEHLRLRHQLHKISHRYRIFIVMSLLAITVSQFSSLLVITATAGSVYFFRTGDLAVCAAVQLIGFLVCLHGAARITHRVQRIVSVVSQWHAMFTCPVIKADNENVGGESASSTEWMDSRQFLDADSDSDWESSFNLLSSFKVEAKDNIDAFQQRQALVTYLQHNSAGITVYGFVLDRVLLQLIFMIELTLVTWLLGKTVGIH
eukprot:c23185_g1_i1 orf=261-1697(+)